jgi:hypothetical protein
MDIKDQVGEAAGLIWRVLDAEGPHTLAQLKKKVPGNGDLTSLAVGWLAREDKIELAIAKKTLRIQLK